MAARFRSRCATPTVGRLHPRGGSELTPLPTVVSVRRRWLLLLPVHESVFRAIFPDHDRFRSRSTRATTQNRGFLTIARNVRSRPNVAFFSSIRRSRILRLHKGKKKERKIASLVLRQGCVFAVVGGGFCTGKVQGIFFPDNT